MEANGTPVIAGVPFGIRPDISKSVMRGDEGEARDCSQAVYGGSDRHAVYPVSYTHLDVYKRQAPWVI